MKSLHWSLKFKEQEYNKYLLNKLSYVRKRTKNMRAKRILWNHQGTSNAVELGKSLACTDSFSLQVLPLALRVKPFSKQHTGIWVSSPSGFLTLQPWPPPSPVTSNISIHSKSFFCLLSWPLTLPLIYIYTSRVKCQVLKAYGII